MTASNVLNIIGLILDIFGVLMLFKYGLPPEVSKDGAVYIICNEHDEEEIKKAKKYVRFSTIALSMLFIGFVFQILANFPNVTIFLNNFTDKIWKAI